LNQAGEAADGANVSPQRMGAFYPVYCEGTRMSTESSQSAGTPAPDTNAGNGIAAARCEEHGRGALESERVLAHIRDALRGLEYGVLSIIVQDGVVIQIERTERKRLRRSN
jgi:hypothetical protein